MKKYLKWVTSVFIIAALSLSMNAGNHVFANDISTACNYNPTSKVNPDYATMNCLLTKTALSYNVPPEIVKAIAEGENSGWKHFDNNGKVIISDDNGIGLMQITNQAGYDEERLKNDIIYNIQAGVEILDKMFKRKDLPTINGGERDVIEHWYFAMMAYNGIKPVNSPIVQATGEKNMHAYQEKILGKIKQFELINVAPLKFKKEDFQYDSNSTNNIKFVKMNYKVDYTLTKSKYYFSANSKVITSSNVHLRSKATTNSSSKGQLNKGEILTITGPFVFDEDGTKKNHFVWYPVKRSDGTTGFVASSYLVQAPDYVAYAKRFADFSTSKWWRDDMIWAVDRGLINGYGNTWYPVTKKYETLLMPDKELTEAHFLMIFFRYAEKEELANAKNTSSWQYSAVYNMAKKYNMPVLASEANATSKSLADKGIRRGKLAQLMASYHFGKTVSENEAIQFFIKNGITTAKSINDYNQNDILTRAQISAFIQRYEAFVFNQY